MNINSDGEPLQAPNVVRPVRKILELESFKRVRPLMSEDLKMVFMPEDISLFLLLP